MPEPSCDLWSLSKSGGCAAKLDALKLHEITSALRPRRDENLLVGIETSDDAAVYRLSDETALVLTVDFITPVCSDPHLYGQIAAANAISDVYAMGGKPVAAMNVCAFPDRVDPATLGRILEGGLAKIEEAGAVLAGGHTVRDDEMKYGLSVTGLVDPKRVARNSGARPGDALVLTKPLGTGVQIAAAKRGLLAKNTLDGVLESMAMLNRTACGTMLAFDAEGCTDITGFGLGGHAFGMARASGVSMRIFPDLLPVYPGTRDLLERGTTTSATPANARALEGKIRFADNVSEAERQLLFDPQTSGGLFIPIRPRDADALVQALRGRGVVQAAVVGECLAADRPGIDVMKS